MAGAITDQQCLRMQSNELQNSAAALGLVTTYGGGMLAVNITLGQSGLGCRSLDSDGDGRVTLDDPLRAVAAALDGCRAGS